MVVTSSTQQLNAAVNLVQQKSPSKKAPLIILHHRRTKGGSAASTYASNLLKKWTQNNTIYTTPTGSNDDWYGFKCEPNPMLIRRSDRIYLYIYIFLFQGTVILAKYPPSVWSYASIFFFSWIQQR